MAAQALRKKKQQLSHVFLKLFWMFTLRWITEKELERVIENKRDKFCTKENMTIQSGGKAMRNASSQQGENEGNEK